MRKGLGEIAKIQALQHRCTAVVDAARNELHFLSASSLKLAAEMQKCDGGVDGEWRFTDTIEKFDVAEFNRNLSQEFLFEDTISMEGPRQSKRKSSTPPRSLDVEMLRKSIGELI
jgi:hypothetical protein